VANSVCSCDERFRSVCEGLPGNYEYEGKRYCVLHLPRGDKVSRFTEVIEQKFRNKDFDFRGIYFPSIPINIEEPRGFSEATFEGEADFSDATFQELSAYFSEATFKESATFHNATFEGRAFFNRCIFEGEANFNEATFKGMANFYYATFEKRALFYDATFEEEAYFAYATFKDIAFFFYTTFQDGANFGFLETSPTQTRLIFRAAVIDKAEGFSFHATYLRPSWFLDVDAQKFDFSDVEWFRLPNKKKLTLEKEIKYLDELPRTLDYARSTPHGNLRRLQRACRKLMNNAEENRDYPTANEFHYWSMELLRKEGWRELGLIGTLYWILSGYGERPRRAFLMLVGMGTLFAILYVMVAGSIEHVGQAFLYSLAAMVRLTGVPAMAPLTKLLQPSEPGLFQLLVTAEGILGPLQIALLALAIRRKVMR
jgi:hypothetical protein